MSDQNKNTFFHWVLENIVTDTFELTGPAAKMTAQPSEKHEVTQRESARTVPADESDAEEWFDKGRVMIMDRPLLQRCLPNGFEDWEPQPLLSYFWEGEDHVILQPDAVLGFRNDFLLPFIGDQALESRIYGLLNVVPGMHHPYLLMQGRCKDDTIRETELKACQIAATLLRCARELREYAYNKRDDSKMDSNTCVDTDMETTTLINTTSLVKPSGSSPDFNTFLFSSITDPQTHTLYVRFAEVCPTSTTVRYHMNRVRQIGWHSPCALSEVRRWCDNISY